MNFAVVDLETTGGSASKHRITEIGIVIYDGKEEIDRYHTLVNPQRPIPKNIEFLTGITQEMVEQAPRFEEVAKTVYDLLSGCIFVAHNVQFDYSFLKAQLAETGYSQWLPRKLCTVRYTRKIVPGLRSYSLKNLVSHFQLENKNPHRALSDAIAAMGILDSVLALDDQEHWKETVKLKNNFNFLPQQISPSDFEAIPKTAGVYYMKGKGGKPLYIGKAKNIQARLKTHFTTHLEAKKTQDLLREVKVLDFVETGSEWMAYLLEDQEIRRYWPEYNKAQKVPKRTYGLFRYLDGKGNERLAINKTRALTSSLRSYYSHPSAIQDLYMIRDAYKLNPELCGIGGSYEYENHNENVVLFAAEARVKNKFYVTLPGRNHDESAFVAYIDDLFFGAGYLKGTQVLNSLDSSDIDWAVSDSSPTNQWKGQQLLDSQEYIQRIEIEKGA